MNTSKVSSDEKMPKAWLVSLRALPSEHGLPSAATDAAILAEARASLAAIRRRRTFRRILPTLATAACLAFMPIFFLNLEQITTPEQAKTKSEDHYAVILREVSALFPDQVKSIVTDGGELQIELTDEPFTNDAQAVVIEACRQGDCTTVITYIGQTVEIGDQRVTVLADKYGGFIFESSLHTVPDLQIKCRKI